MTKLELQEEIEALRGKLFRATGKLNKILCDEYEFKPGMMVNRGGATFTVSSVLISYGKPMVFGKKTLKDGSLSKQEFELYGPLERI